MEDAIGKNIELSLLEWNIDFIFTVTVDNASSNSTTNQETQIISWHQWNGQSTTLMQLKDYCLG